MIYTMSCFIHTRSLVFLAGCVLEGKSVNEGETMSLSADPCTTCTCTVILLILSLSFFFSRLFNEHDVSTLLCLSVTLVGYYHVVQ